MRQVQTASFGVPEYEPQREGTYRPRIQPDQLRWLWVVKQRTGKPMTVLVREALEYYFAAVPKGGDSRGPTKADPGAGARDYPIDGADVANGT